MERGKETKSNVVGIKGEGVTDAEHSSNSVCTPHLGAGCTGGSPGSRQGVMTVVT